MLILRKWFSFLQDFCQISKTNKSQCELEYAFPKIIPCQPNILQPFPI